MIQHKKEMQKIREAASYFIPKGAFIAGGALTSAFTNEAINDVDIYFKTKEDFINAVQEAYEESMWCVAATDRAITFANKDKIVQLMHFDFFAAAEAVFDAFDFTVCMAAYDTDKEVFEFHEDFFKHASQRFLKFHSGTRYPFGSLMRVLKYQGRGYTIGNSDLLRIGLKCHSVPLESWDDLAAAIGGQYGEKAKIETDKEFSIDDAVEVFNDVEIQTVPTEEMPNNAYDLLLKVGIEYEELANETHPSGPKSFWD